MKTKRSAFNLIELTLAIAVVGIGIASVMALFIPAMNAATTPTKWGDVGGVE